MNRTELIERVLETHEISLVVTGPWGETSHVTLRMPDLRRAPRSVWGDWGPMYTVSLPRDRAVEVSVKTGGTRMPTPPLDLDRLEIDSPRSASVREVTPLVLKLPLPTPGRLLHVFYGTEGRPVRAELAVRESSSGATSDPHVVTVAPSPATRVAPHPTGNRQDMVAVGRQTAE